MSEVDPQLSAYLEAKLARACFGEFLLTGEYSFIDASDEMEPFVMKKDRHGYARHDETLLKYSGGLESDVHGIDFLSVRQLHGIHQRLTRFISGMHVHCDHDFRLPASDRHFSAVTFEHGFAMLYDEAQHIVAPGIARITFEQQSESPGHIISSVSASVQGLGIDLIYDPLVQLISSDLPAHLEPLGYPNFEFGLHFRAFSDGTLSLTNPLRYDSTVYIDNQALLHLLNIYISWQDTFDTPAAYIDTPNHILCVGVSDKPRPDSLQSCLSTTPDPLKFNNSFFPTFVSIQQKNMMCN